MAINLRSTKGSALTHTEMDTNLTSFYVSSSLNGTTLNFFTHGTGSFSATTHSVDLLGFLDNTDIQSLSVVGDQLSITNGNTVTLPTGSDTTYTAGVGLTLTGTEFSFTGSLFSGDYNDLINQPTIPTVPTNVSAFVNDAGYLTVDNDTTYTAGVGLTLTGTEFSFTGSLFSGDYNDLTNQPILFDGDYNSLTNQPTIPTVPTNVSAFTNDAGYITVDNDTTYTAGTGIDITNEVVTNTAPDRIVSIEGSNITVNGTYPNFQLTGSVEALGAQLSHAFTYFTNMSDLPNAGSNMDTPAPVSGSFVIPDQIFSSNILYDSSSGYFTLPSNKIFKLKAHISINNPGGTDSDEFRAQWKNIDTGEMLGKRSLYHNDDNNNYSEDAYHIINTTSTTRVGLVSVHKNGNCNINTYSTHIDVEEIGVGIINDITGSAQTGSLLTTAQLVGENLRFTRGNSTTFDVSLSSFMDEDARAIASGVLDGPTGIVTFTRDDASTFTLDLSDLLDDTNLVTSVNGANGVVVLDTDDIAEGTTNFYDKTVSITGQNITVNGTYPNFQLTGSAAYTETDPIFLASDAAGITSTDISNWDTAHGWGDHSTAGYLTSYTETDPIFGASAASGISATDISNWDTAHGWGDHSTAGYLTSYTEVDTLATVTGRGSSTTTSITAANFITTSDERLKSDIRPIASGLATLKRFLSYEYVKDGLQDAGFIAQEVKQAIPYSVFEGKNGYLTMNDRPILAHMHKAILELEQRLAAIESKLD